jgi:hypothetical protein
MSIRSGRDTRIAALVAAALLLAALAVLGLRVGDADAVAAKVLGKAQEKTKPTCPKENCQATGKVSGYQFAVDGERRLFKVPTDGRMVAWSIELANPDKLSQDFFEANLTRKGYGGDPYARIGVLKRVDGKKPNSFKLVKQTPAINLINHLGETPIFTLSDRLKLKKGQIVALSVPTWASNFVAGDSTSTQWRASRDSDKCDLSPGHDDNREATKPQMNVGSVREYGCRYNGERLLYKAYYVPDK